MGDFDPEKLLQNAVTSIRLGVEDFVLCQGQEGDEGRALSSVRNIFAGLTVLFKYGLVKVARDS